MHSSTHLHEVSREGGDASGVPLELATADFAEGLVDATQQLSATASEEGQAIDRQSWLEEMYGNDNNRNLQRHLAGAAMRDEKLSRATEQAFRP